MSQAFPIKQDSVQSSWAERNRDKMRQSNREYYARNREARKAKMNSHTPRRIQRARALKAAAVEAFGGRCKDCGFQGPQECFQFDHVRGEKVSSVGRMFTAAAIETLLLELIKCELVCANCHAIRTRLRQQERPHRRGQVGHADSGD